MILTLHKPKEYLKCLEKKPKYLKGTRVRMCLVCKQYLRSYSLKSKVLSLPPSNIYNDTIRNDYICRKNEETDFLGLILHGQVFISLDHAKLKTLNIGDMTGFMNVSELTTEVKNKYDIIAETDGIIAVLPFGEIKSESRKNP